MIVARCDINTCRRELDPALIKKARIMDLEYDLCDECFASLQSFIQVRMTGGKQPAANINWQDFVKPAVMPSFPQPLQPWKPFGTTTGVPNITWGTTSDGTEFCISNSGVKTSPLPPPEFTSIPFDQLIGQVDEILSAIGNQPSNVTPPAVATPMHQPVLPTILYKKG